MEVLDVSPAVGRLVAAVLHVPDRGTSEVAVGLVLLNQIVGNRWLKVARSRCSRRAGKTDEELGVLAGGVGEEANPGIVVEAVARRVTGNGVAGRIVIELDEEQVKDSLGDHGLHLEVVRVQRTLRCSGNNVGTSRGGRLVKVRVQTVDQSNIAALIGKLGLNVKVEAIHGHVFGRTVEGTWTGPAGVVGTEGTPQEVGKVLALLLARHGVVDTWHESSSNRQQNLLSIRLAGRDALDDLLAVLVQARLGRSDLEELSTAVLAKVRTGIPGSRVLLGGIDDEGDGHIIKAVRLAVRCQTLSPDLTPVGVDCIVGDHRRGSKSCQSKTLCKHDVLKQAIYDVLSEATVIRPRPRKRECDDTKVKERTQNNNVCKERPIAHRLEVDWTRRKECGREKRGKISQPEDENST